MSDMLASAGGQIGQATGLSNIAGGLKNLFTGGSQAMTPEQAAGAVMPSGNLFGVPLPPQPAITPTPSPNFLQGFVQGFTGVTPGQGADFPMSPGAQIAGGVGQLFHAINQLRNPGQVLDAGLQSLAGVTPTPPGAGTPPAPVVNVPSKPLQGPETAQTPLGYQQAQSKDPLEALVKAAMIVAAL